jgi:hypothetical protein
MAEAMFVMPGAQAPQPVWGGFGDELLRYLDRAINDPNFLWIFAILVGVLALFIITRGKWR